MNKAILVLLGSVMGQFCQGQVLWTPIMSSYVGNGAYSSTFVDVFSALKNQASFSQLNNSTYGIYGERRYFLKELNYYRAIAVLHTSIENFAISGSYSGTSDYNETELGIAHARMLGEKITIGVQFNYNTLQLGAYGAATALGFELGTIIQLTNQLRAGLHIRNPVGGKFGGGFEKLPSLFTLGVGYEPSHKFYISIEIIKEEDQPPNGDIGFQYRFHTLMIMKAGISSFTGSAWLGVGLILPVFRIDLATGYHPQLGYSPLVSIIYNGRDR